MARNSTAQWINTPIQLMMGLHKTEGEIGVEIEVEGVGLPRQLQYHWDVHQDGSLRGLENAEYVFRGPAPRDTVRKRLDYLASQLKKSGARVDSNQRTSVHVHINAQELTFLQTMNIVTTYLIYEDLFAEIAGETRMGNLFCLRSSDAEYMVQQIRQIFNGRGHPRDYLRNNDAIRYAAINLAALGRYGSLEFRSLRGTTDPDIIMNWVNLLLCLWDWAIKQKDPQAIVQNFSVIRAFALTRQVFPEGIYQQFTTLKDYEARMFQGMRQAQDIAYATDWTVESVVSEPLLPYKDLVFDNIMPEVAIQPAPLRRTAQQAQDAVMIQRGRVGAIQRVRDDWIINADGRVVRREEEDI